MSPVSASAARRNGNARALAVGIVVGIVYQMGLSPLQPHIEPAWVWVEVAVGTILAFAVAEVVALRQERVGSYTSVLAWRDYRAMLLAAFVGVGVPLVSYEIVTHLVLGRAV